MDRTGIEKRIEEISRSEAETRSFELVKVELGGTKRDQVVRIYIDKEGGITLEDCSLFSHAVEEVFDAEDLIPTRYVLEVSSPGIERELFSPDDFRRFEGKLAKVKYRSEGEQKTISGRIAGVDGSLIKLEEKRSGVTVIDHADILKANLKIDLSEEFGARR
ncbi:MAG: ribosome maturation factor RimP [Acidobacteriota bacterium]|nr:MAG: ribosome maturation factor RimP [Acidobacteriota bacterium]